ncbi:MAG: hypothetical protein ACK4TG_12655, partial [Thermaurantiacus sp.]
PAAAETADPVAAAEATPAAMPEPPADAPATSLVAERPVPAQGRPRPVETVFPLPRAPDDPGPPEPTEAQPKRMSFFRG